MATGGGAGGGGNAPGAFPVATGTGAVASWTACWFLDNVTPTSDGLYHQGLSYEAMQNYVVLGQSWNAAGCRGAPDDTFNDFSQVLQRTWWWWFTHWPNYKYVKFIWVDAGGHALQDTGCLDYNLIGPCPN